MQCLHLWRLYHHGAERTIMDIKKEKPGSQMAKKLQEGLSKADEAGKKLGTKISIRRFELFVIGE